MGAPDNDFVSGCLLLEGRSVCLAVRLAVCLSGWLWAGCLLEPCSSAGTDGAVVVLATVFVWTPAGAASWGQSPPPPLPGARMRVSCLFRACVWSAAVPSPYAYFLTESRRPSTFQRRKLSHGGLPQSLQGRAARGTAGLALDPGLGAKSL